MKKLFLTLSIALATLSASAIDNLFWNDGVTIHTLGEAKEWTSKDGATYTFDTDDLQKLIQNPTNTSNVFLFPEAQNGGGWDTPENRTLGIQEFYIDLGKVHEIATVTTTWEGAAAKIFNIYLTNEVPTRDVLSTDPIYTSPDLGQYTSNTFALPDGAKGRYLVFQGIEATNWGWGVKMRSISATGPEDDILTSFKVSPGIVAQGSATTLELSYLNQVGLDIDASEISLSVNGDGEVEYNDGVLTIISGTYATFTASLGDESLTATVYAAVAPQVPDMASIKTPIFTNGLTEYNNKVEWTTAYNGGGVNLGTLTFDDGTIAQLFGDARCVFFSNSETTGAWNGNIFPSEKGYKSLKLDVFSAKNVTCSIEFEHFQKVENVESDHTFYFELQSGKWNTIEVDVEGVFKLENLSIRFSEADMDDILLTNIYFTPITETPSTPDAPALDEVSSNQQQVVVKANKNHNLWYKVGIYDPTTNAQSIVTYAASDVLQGYTKAETTDDENLDTIESDDTHTTYTFNVKNMLSAAGLSSLDDLKPGQRLSLSVYAEDPVTDTLSDEMLIGVDSEKTTGVDSVAVDSEASRVDVYNLQGVRVRSNVCAQDALNNLPNGIYIVGGKKVIKK